jgi:hypothetical protein
MGIHVTSIRIELSFSLLSIAAILLDRLWRSRSHTLSHVVACLFVILWRQYMFINNIVHQ